MLIDNVRVYDMQESIVASGLPMRAQYDASEFTGAAFNMPDDDLNGVLSGADYDQLSAAENNVFSAIRTQTR